MLHMHDAHNTRTCHTWCTCMKRMIHLCVELTKTIYINSVYIVFLAGESLNIRSYTFLANPTYVTHTWCTCMTRMIHMHDTHDTRTCHTWCTCMTRMIHLRVGLTKTKYINSIYIVFLAGKSLNIRSYMVLANPTYVTHMIYMHDAHDTRPCHTWCTCMMRLHRHTGQSLWADCCATQLKSPDKECAKVARMPWLHAYNCA
jgi:hypothetical protein